MREDVRAWVVEGTTISRKNTSMGQQGHRVSFICGRVCVGRWMGVGVGVAGWSDGGRVPDGVDVQTADSHGNAGPWGHGRRRAA